MIRKGFFGVLPQSPDNSTSHILSYQKAPFFNLSFYLIYYYYFLSPIILLVKCIKGKGSKKALRINDLR
jgi:hypothetical protein